MFIINGVSSFMSATASKALEAGQTVVGKASSLAQSALSLVPSWRNSAGNSHSVSQLPVVDQAAQKAKVEAIFCKIMLDQFTVLHTLRHEKLSSGDLNRIYKCYSARYTQSMAELQNIGSVTPDVKTRLNEIDQKITEIKNFNICKNDQMKWWKFWQFPKRNEIDLNIQTCYKNAIAQFKQAINFVSHSQDPFAKHIFTINRLNDDLKRSQGFFSFFARRELEANLRTELAAVKKTEQQAKQGLEHPTAATAGQQA